MAGYGRNLPVLQKKFNNIEMLDGAEDMASGMPQNVTKHVQYIQEFNWPEQKYDCVVGVFCLSYLDEEEIDTVLNKMYLSLNHFGYIVLMEPVLQVEEDVKERQQKITEQKMTIRSVKYYKKRFQKLQIALFSGRIDEKKG